MSPVVHLLGLAHSHCWGLICSVPGRQLKSVRRRARRKKKKRGTYPVMGTTFHRLPSDSHSSQLISPPLALLSGTERPNCSKDPSAWCPRSTVPSGKEAQVSVSPSDHVIRRRGREPRKVSRIRNYVHPQLSFFLGLRFCTLIWERNFHKWDSDPKGKWIWEAGRGYQTCFHTCLLFLTPANHVGDLRSPGSLIHRENANSLWVCAAWRSEMEP